MARFLPQSGRRTGLMIRRGYGLSAATAIAGSVIFLLIVVRPGSSYAELAGLGAGAVFVGCVVIWSLFTLQDGALVGLRSARWVAVENALFGVAKIGMLLPLAVILPHTGLYVSWMAPAIVAVPAVNLLIFRRLLPRHAERAAGQSAAKQPPGRPLPGRRRHRRPLPACHREPGPCAGCRVRRSGQERLLLHGLGDRGDDRHAGAEHGAVAHGRGRVRRRPGLPLTAGRPCAGRCCCSCRSPSAPCCSRRGSWDCSARVRALRCADSRAARRGDAAADRDRAVPRRAARAEPDDAGGAHPGNAGGADPRPGAGSHRRDRNRRRRGGRARQPGDHGGRRAAGPAEDARGWRRRKSASPAPGSAATVEFDMHIRRPRRWRRPSVVATRPAARTLAVPGRAGEAAQRR